MGLTTDRSDPDLKKIEPTGQQAKYLVLSEEERARGFVMPVHRSYVHVTCGSRTDMGLALCETYAHNPKFYGGTFCCDCGKHFNLGPPSDPAFLWPDGTPVGANAEEAAEYLSKQADLKAAKDEGKGI